MTGPKEATSTLNLILAAAVQLEQSADFIERESVFSADQSGLCSASRLYARNNRNLAQQLRDLEAKRG